MYQPMHQTSAGKWAIGILAGAIIGIAAVLTLGYLGLQVGIVGLLLGTMFAIVPVPLIALAAMWLSRFQAQPWTARLFAFGWGASVAIVGSLLLEIGGGLVTGGNPVIGAVVNAPLAEESCKAVAILLLFAISRTSGILPNAAKCFTGPVDGIAYAMFVGAGFAFSENIQYLGRAYAQGQMVNMGALALGLTFLFRCVLSPFAHPLFTSVTGLCVGLAARPNQHLALRVLAPVGGWTIAVFCHGTFNAVVTVLFGGSLESLAIGYLVVLVPMFLVGLGVAVLARSLQFRAVPAGLAAYVPGGWISQAEVGMLATLRGRAYARRTARQLGGSAGAEADRELQFAATRLAILRDAVNRGLTVSANFATEERELLVVIGRQRQVLSGFRYGLGTLRLAFR